MGEQPGGPRRSAPSGIIAVAPASPSGTPKSVASKSAVAPFGQTRGQARGQTRMPLDLLLLTTLLVACGGENRYLTVTNPATTAEQPPPDPTPPDPTPPDPTLQETPPDVAFSAGNGDLVGSMTEGRRHVAALDRMLAALPDIADRPEISNLTLVDSRTANFTLGSGDTAVAYRLRIGGDDAPRLVIETRGDDAAVLRLVFTPDYENPLDFQSDNRVDFTLTLIRTEDGAPATAPNTAAPITAAPITANVALTITDDPADGPTQVTPAATYRAGPAYSREGDSIRIGVEEGSVPILEMRNLDLSRDGGTAAFLISPTIRSTLENAAFLQDALRGADSAAVQLLLTGDGQLTALQLEFAQAPDHAALLNRSDKLPIGLRTKLIEVIRDSKYPP